MKFKWIKIEQDDFEEIKWILDRNILLAYPDFNKTFKIDTDAKNFQLGAVISQNGKKIAFCNRKLDDVHRNYTLI